MARRSVVLVHGILNTERVFDRMAGFLRGRGFDVHSLNLVPFDGSTGLEDLAGQLKAHVEKTIPPGQEFDLVGFSMRGIVSRFYAQRLGGAARVRRLVTISAPHNGTALAWLWGNKGCLDMRIGSPFLADLNGTLHELDGVELSSLWTPYDLVILPADSSVLPVGRSIRLPIGGVMDRRALDLVAGILEG